MVACTQPMICKTSLIPLMTKTVFRRKKKKQEKEEEKRENHTNRKRKNIEFNIKVKNNINMKIKRKQQQHKTTTKPTPRTNTKASQHFRYSWYNSGNQRFDTVNVTKDCCASSMARWHPNILKFLFIFLPFARWRMMKLCVHASISTVRPRSSLRFKISFSTLTAVSETDGLWFPLFPGAMLNPFPKETSSYSTIQPSNTQISDSTDNRMEHLLLKMEDSQRQHQHTLLQVLHIVPRRNWILPFFSKMFFSPHPSLVKLFSKQWLPSWERSHIPSQLALLSRWFSELHSRWDILVPWRVIIHLILPNRNYGGSFI